jgi:hypothetical protein
MTFILRWPAILVLLALVLVCFAGALAAAGVLTGVEVPAVGVEQIDLQVAQAQAAAAETGAAEAGWLDVGLLGGAGLFFLVSAIRLIRRTQGFWTWLFGFALFGGRWAWAQQQSGGLLETVQSIDPNVYAQPQAVLADLGSPAAQIGVLAIVLLVGVLILIVDAADRAHWDRQGA